MSSDFISHLEELRRRLIISLSVFCAATVVAFFYSHPILDFLTRPLTTSQPGATLFFQQPHEAFMIHIKVAAFTGLIVSSPVIITQLWLFVVPALYQKEKLVTLSVILISAALFIAGTVFSYTLIIPWSLAFLLSYQTEGLKPLLAIEPYFSFLSGMSLSFGVLFDFPVVIAGLVMLGVVQTQTLARMRKVVIIIIFIVAAVVTPSPDPVSQLLLAIPLWILFEISLIVAGIIEKNKKKNSEAKNIQSL